LSALFLVTSSSVKGDVVFEVNLTGLSDGAFESAELSVVGTITVDPSLPINASNFSSNLTFIRTELFGTPASTSLTEVEFVGDTANNLEFVAVDSELFVRRTGTDDSQLIISADPASLDNSPVLTFGSGQFESSFGSVVSGGFIAGFDSVTLREAGGIGNLRIHESPVLPPIG